MVCVESYGTISSRGNTVTTVNMQTTQPNTTGRTAKVMHSTDGIVDGLPQFTAFQQSPSLKEQKMQGTVVCIYVYVYMYIYTRMYMHMNMGTRQARSHIRLRELAHLTRALVFVHVNVMDVVVTLDVTENKVHQNTDDIKIILISKTRLYESQTIKIRSAT